MVRNRPQCIKEVDDEDNEELGGFDILNNSGCILGFLSRRKRPCAPCVESLGAYN